jgi:hypothetical protein
LRRKLALRIEREREEARLAKQAAAERVRRSTPLTQGEIGQKLALYAAAKALVV